MTQRRPCGHLHREVVSVALEPAGPGEEVGLTSGGGKERQLHEGLATGFQ